MQNHIPNIQYTIRNNLCVGCGICQCACPSGALSIKCLGSEFRPVIDSCKCNNSKGCHRCYDSCPGLGINLISLAKEYYCTNDTIEDKYAGRYLKCYQACSSNNEVRLNSASGGTLSQFLIWLLENNKIDGAVVTKFDKNSPLKVKTFIATTRDDILSAKSSKYSPVTLNHAAQDIKNASGNRYVVVGLPCHIQGFRKLEKIDKILRENVIGHFSLFCSGSQSFNYTEYILQQSKIDVEKLDYLAYREGEPSGMVAKGVSISLFKKYGDYNRPLKSTFYPRRCPLCVDFQGELADIAFGDIAAKPEDDFGNGMNAVIVRSSEWLSLFEQASKDGAIISKEITLERINYKRAMAKLKKNQNASFVNLLRKLGRVVPDYYNDYNSHASLKTFIKYANKRFKQLIGRNKSLWFLLPKIK